MAHESERSEAWVAIPNEAERRAQMPPNECLSAPDNPRRMKSY